MENAPRERRNCITNLPSCSIALQRWRTPEEIAIEELQNTVAELQAAEEALRQQQDELNDSPAGRGGAGAIRSLI